jgi:hypothetical protein
MGPGRRRAEAREFGRPQRRAWSSIAEADAPSGHCAQSHRAITLASLYLPSIIAQCAEAALCAARLTLLRRNHRHAAAACRRGGPRTCCHRLEGSLPAAGTSRRKHCRCRRRAAVRQTAPHTLSARGAAAQSTAPAAPRGRPRPPGRSLWRSPCRSMIGPRSVHPTFLALASAELPMCAMALAAGRNVH